MISGSCVGCNKRTQGRFNNSFLCKKCQLNKESDQIVELFNEMDQFDYGWLIGLIEGEGCFYQKNSCNKLKDGIYCYPLAGFSIMSTDYDVMERAANLLKLNINGPYYKSVERKEVWSIQITGNKALAIMKHINAYMSQRRQQQIAEAIEWQKKGKFRREHG